MKNVQEDQNVTYTWANVIMSGYQRSQSEVQRIKMFDLKRAKGGLNNVKNGVWREYRSSEGFQLLKLMF